MELFKNSGEIHRVVAQVAGHDRITDGANDRNVVRTLTTIDGRAQSCSTDIQGVGTTITGDIAGADSSTDVDGVGAIRRGGVRQVATVNGGVLDRVLGEVDAVFAFIAVVLGTSTLAISMVSLPSPPNMVEVLKETVIPRESLPFWP